MEIIVFALVFILLSIGSIKFVLSLLKRVEIDRTVLIAFGLFAIFGSLAMFFYMRSEETESFRQGVELLKSNKNINDKIGSFESYSFNENNMPDEKDNPAILHVSLEGSKAKIFLTCKIKKDKADDKWHFIEVKQDSIKNRP